LGRLETKMRIAVASGKGGTGKTTVATSLALSLAPRGNVWYVDCDVEAPNGHIFLKPQFNQALPAGIRIPKIDPELCSLCGRCVEVCQFHALAKIGKTILVFPQLCHGCGSCTWNCPEQAITEQFTPIGSLALGRTESGLNFAHGILTISEPMATPVIRQLKRQQQFTDCDVIVFDAPPGASCSVVETLRGVDFVLLVTEPTPFGLHDLKQMLGIVSEMGLPAGLVINRESGAYPPLAELCASEKLPVLMRIPFNRQYAEGLAKGQTLIQIAPEYVKLFQEVYDQISTILNLPGSQAEPNQEKP